MSKQQKSEIPVAAASPCSAWNLCSDVMPDLGQIVWLYDAVINTVWLGSREDDVDGWLWGNAYGTVWHTGEKWDADVETDDDYTPTHWLALPSLPNAKSAGTDASEKTL
jgi:hypothetical protein